MSEVPLYHIRSAEEGQASLASGLSPGLGKGTSGNYWGTLLIRKRTALGPYRRHAPRVLRGSRGGGCFPIGEAPLYEPCTNRGARRCPLFGGAAEDQACVPLCHTSLREVTWCAQTKWLRRRTTSWHGQARLRLIKFA